MKRKILAFLLVISMVISLASCTITLPKPGTGNGTGTGTGMGTGNGSGAEDDGSGSSGGSGAVVVPGDDETDASDGLDTETVGETSVRAFLGEQITLAEMADEMLGEGEKTWVSECEGILTVDDGGIVTPVKCGRTTVKATDSLGNVMTFRVMVEFKVYADGGYSIVTDVVDENTYVVKSAYEANRVIDLAIFEHKAKITIDFSGISDSFMLDDFDLDVELGNHVSFKTSYYPSKPQTVYFEIVYNADAASEKSTVSAQNKLGYVDNGNALVRQYFGLGDSARADDYEGFKINSVTNTADVYNSEELWWAVEHGYRPVFPMENTKAELFYERAKMILRDIVTDSMTDYEKVVAIYDYLVDNVAYDYDAYSLNSGKNNTCYFLEGVFEAGLAVCDGKTKAFVLFCGIEGISCLRDFGSSRSGGAGHAWNYVLLGDEWYLIDTTEGDTRYTVQNGSGITSFFGTSIEAVSYRPLLLAIDSHGDKYNYGEIWHTIFDNADGIYPDASDMYFSYDLGEKYDLTLSSEEEAKALIDAVMEMIGDDGAIKFYLSVMLEGPENMIHRYLDAADDYGLETAVYTLDYDGERVYFILFKTA